VRVLQVDSGREWRGGQNQVRLLCRELARNPAVDVRLVTGSGSELARRAIADGVAVLEVPWRLSLDWRATWALSNVVWAFRPDIVHAHDSHALRLCVGVRDYYGRYSGLFAVLSSSWRDLADSPPTVVGTRRVDFHVRRRRGLAKLFLGGDSPWARADYVIAISEAVKRILVADGLVSAGISVVPSGVDADDVRRAARQQLDVRGQLGLPPETPLAVNVAALVDHKDQRTLIHAARHARARRPDLHWAIAGEGALRGSLEAEIAGLELRDRVHLLGYVDGADALIGEADVFVMSSKEEGLGSVILNALALEKPVVATAGGGIPEILPPESLVPVGDAEGLARKVVAALDHPSVFPLPARFTAQAMAQGVLAVYRTLL
jgi:glycosyltransferase involved in cell wall biosynthesis